MSEQAHELLRILEWDSAHFGMIVGSIFCRSLSAFDMASVIDAANAQEVRCLYWLADASDGSSLALAHKYGFGFIDFRMEFSVVSPIFKDSGSRGTQQTREAVDNDIDSLVEIARTAHLDSRFSKDSGFAQDRVANLYEQWLINSIREEAVIVANGDYGQPLGYVAWKSENSGSVGRISLLAVAQNARGKGVGRLLIESCVKKLFENGHHEIRVVTQGCNLTAQRVYQSCGFRTCDAAVWFHRWSW